MHFLLRELDIFLIILIDIFLIFSKSFAVNLFFIVAILI